MTYIQRTGSGNAPPVLIGPTETFTVADNTQVLYAMTIDVEGFIAIDGYLIEVD